MAKILCEDNALDFSDMTNNPIFCCYNTIEVREKDINSIKFHGTQIFDEMVLCFMDPPINPTIALLTYCLYN